MPTRDRQRPRRQRVLVVTCRSASGDDPDCSQITAALDYARISYAVADLGDSPSLADLDAYSAVVLATENLREIDDLSVWRLTDFVTNGGGLVAAVPLWHHKLAPLLGVERCHGRQTDFDTAPLLTTIEFVTDFYPGLGHLRAPLPFQENNLALTLLPGEAVRVIAVDEGGDPVAWEHRYGRGKVVAWNTRLLSTRFGIGVLVQSVLHSHRAAAAPIANAGVVQIDDFPAGFANLAAEPLLTEFGLRFVDFLRQVWLPDMLRIGEEFDVTYTFFVMFAYNGDIAPPFSFAEWELLSNDEGPARLPLPVAMAREVAGRHELGLHGYNHLPPTRDAWSDERHLAAALRAALERWERDGLGAPPRCFVPAMNEIDPFGLRALASAAPSVTTISGHYLGYHEMGQARDYGPEPWSPRLFSLPRLTDGYEMHPMNRFFMVSSLAAFGVWSHFLHPDDVIDTRANFPDRTSFRNELDRMWRRSTRVESYESLLRGWFRFAGDTFPWLRYRSTSDARTVVEEHLRSRPEVRFDDDGIRIHSRGPLQLQLRISENDLDVVPEDGSVEVESSHRGAGYSLHTIRKAPGRASLRLRPSARSARISTTAPPLRPRAGNDRRTRRLCFVADTEDWAFDNIAKSVRRRLPPHFNVEIRYRDAYETEAELHRDLFLGPVRWDHVHYFWHPSLGFLFDPEVSFELLSPLDEERRRYVVDRVARTVKTTSVYSHQFLSEKESDRILLTSLALADGYSVASSRLRESYGAREFLPPPTAVLSDGVDLDRFRPFHLGRLRDTDRTIRVGWAGNSAWGEDVDHKGLETIIRPLLARFASEGLDVRGKFCDRRIAWTPRDTMPAYYSRIDVYVCASLSEGTPNPVLEAMACGLPVLSTDVGIVREVFGPLQQEFIVGDRASSEFAGKLRRLVTDPALRTRLARENLESVRAWSWEERAGPWIHFLSEVESRKRRSDSTPRQIAALYRAFDAGRQIHLSRRTPPVATSSGGGPGAFLLKRLRAYRTGSVDGTALLDSLRHVVRFLSLACRSDRSVEQWCDERGLPRCYPSFDWWRYLADYGDLAQAGIETPHDAARHWLAYGRREHRDLWPNGFASAVRRFRALRRRASPSQSGPHPAFSVVVDRGREGARTRTRLDSVAAQVGASLECHEVRPEGAPHDPAHPEAGGAPATAPEARPGQRGAGEALNRAVLQARGDWILTLAPGDRLSRPDSLRTALAAARADTDLLAWRHGSSHGTVPLESLLHRIRSGDDPVAGFAVRRRFRRLLVDDGYRGSGTRTLRRLTRSLRTGWIDDVLTHAEAASEDRSTAPPHPSDLEASGLASDVGLVLAFWRNRRLHDLQRQSFWRERFYSFFFVKEPSASRELTELLLRQNGSRVLLLRPDVRLAPHFRHRCSRDVAGWGGRDGDLCFVSGHEGRPRPLAIVTDAASLGQWASRDGVFSFDGLFEGLRSVGRPFAAIETELFEPLEV